MALMDTLKQFGLGSGPLSGLGTDDPYAGFKNNPDVMKKAGLQADGTYGTFNMNDPDGFDALYNDHAALVGAGGNSQSLMSKDQFRNYLLTNNEGRGTGKYSVDANGNVTTPHDSVADTGFEKIMNGLAQGLAFAPLAPMIGGAAGIGGLSNLTGGPASWFGGEAASGLGDLAATDLAGTGGVASSGGAATLPTGAASGVGAGGMTGGIEGNLLDPSYWNPLGGTEGLAAPGASGVAGSTATYGGSQGLMQQLQSMFTNPSGAPPGTQSVLSKIFQDGGSATDWLKLAGAIVPGALQALGSTQKQAELQKIADQFRTDRSGALARFNSLLAGGPQGFYAGEGAGALQSVLSKINAQSGGIAGSPSAQKLAAEWALGNYGSTLNGAGALAFGDNGLQATLASNAATAGQGLWTGLADAAGRSLTQPTDLASMLAMLKGLNLKDSLG